MNTHTIWDILLKSSTNTRTNTGSVDEAALVKLFDELPRIPGIARETLRDFSAQTLGVPATEISLKGVRELNTEGSKGFSGAPLYLIFDPSGKKVGVIKVFPWSGGYGPKGFVMELSALERLGKKEFDTFQVTNLLGVAKALTADGEVGVLLTSVALGQPFDNLMFAVRDGFSPQARQNALQDLHHAVAATGQLLAELHSKPSGSGDPVSQQQVSKHVAVMQGSLDFIQARAEEIGIQLEIKELRTMVNELISNFKHHPGGSALVHGDPNPGNFLYHPTFGITIIDASSLHSSMNAHGNPIGCPAADLARFENGLLRYGELFDKEVDQLRVTFRQAYQAGKGAQITNEARRFFDVQTMLGDLIASLLEDESLLEEIDKQVERIQTKMRRAKGVV